MIEQQELKHLQEEITEIKAILQQFQKHLLPTQRRREDEQHDEALLFEVVKDK